MLGCFHAPIFHYCCFDRRQSHWRPPPLVELHSVFSLAPPLLCSLLTLPMLLFSFWILPMMLPFSALPPPALLFSVLVPLLPLSSSGEPTPLHSSQVHRWGKGARWKIQSWDCHSYQTSGSSSCVWRRWNSSSVSPGWYYVGWVVPSVLKSEILSKQDQHWKQLSFSWSWHLPLEMLTLVSRHWFLPLSLAANRFSKSGAGPARDWQGIFFLGPPSLPWLPWVKTDQQLALSLKFLLPRLLLCLFYERCGCHWGSWNIWTGRRGQGCLLIRTLSWI